MAKKRILTVKCPTCGKDVDWDTNPVRPFCSERCRLIDLGKWSDEEYRIEGEKITEDDGKENSFTHNES